MSDDGGTAAERAPGAPASKASRQAPRPAATAAGTLTVLVVEDDAATAELVRTVLNEVPGWGATVVYDAAAAREVTRHVRVDALVVDVHLPGISGVELLQLLGADPHWHAPPAVLVSTAGEPPGAREALARGTAAAFLAKPFDIDDLVATIRRAVAVRAPV